MRISDWSSDVCSSDLQRAFHARGDRPKLGIHPHAPGVADGRQIEGLRRPGGDTPGHVQPPRHGSGHAPQHDPARNGGPATQHRSEEHTSELQSLMRISYAVFCLKKKTHTHTKP